MSAGNHPRLMLPYDIGGGGAPAAPAAAPAAAAPARTPIVADDATNAAYTMISNISLPALGAPNPVTLTGSFVRPDLTAYDQKYTEAFNQTRSGIANQLSRAMTDIQTQENLANQAIATLDPRYAEVFSGAKTNAETFAQRGTEAAEALGLSGAGMRVDPNMLAALGGAEGAFKASTGLVGLGSQQLHGQARGRMEQANLGALADIAGKEQEWIGRRAELDTRINQMENEWNTTQNQMRLEEERARRQEQLERQRIAEQRAIAQAEIRSREAQANADRKEAARARAASERSASRDPIADYRSKAEIDYEIANRNGGPPTEMRQNAEATLRQTGRGITPDKGRALMELGQAEELRRHPAYQSLTDFVAKKGGSEWYAKDPAKKAAEIKKEFAKKPWDRTMSLLLAELESGANIASTKPKDRLGWWR